MAREDAPRGGPRPTTRRSPAGHPVGRGLSRGVMPGQSGFFLVECLVYITVWFIIAGLAFAAFYRVLSNATLLRHNADDIARALQAGEIWRSDVRIAIAPLRTITEPGSTFVAVHIPQKTNEVVYYYTGSSMFRRSHDEAPWSEVLGRLIKSRMLEDSRGPIRAWRWEIELRSAKKSGVVRPLFTFEAVPPQKESP